MPIRINLLAEAQIAEEMRRKDPVKRSFIGAALCVALVLLWVGVLQLRIIASSSSLKKVSVKWNAIEPDYKVVVESQRQLIEVEQKLSALDNLRTNRFLWGTALNAFQKTVNGVEHIQVRRLKAEQSYTKQEEVKPGGNAPPNTVPRAATATEKIVISIDATDSSAQPGSQVTKYKDAILTVPFFKERLQQTNGVLLTSLSAPQTGPEGNSPFVRFTLQCFFPEKVR